jgi:hypothetical protein
VEVKGCKYSPGVDVYQSGMYSGPEMKKLLAMGQINPRFLIFCLKYTENIRQKEYPPHQASLQTDERWRPICPWTNAQCKYHE